MNTSDTSALVERHLQMMAEAPVDDEATAQQALAYMLSAVGGMNQSLWLARDQSGTVAGSVDDIVKKLEDWIKSLVAKLTEIAKQL